MPTSAAFDRASAPPSLNEQRLAWLKDEGFRNWLGEEAAHIWRGALNDQDKAVPPIEAMTADINSVTWKGSEPEIIQILINAPGFDKGAVINIRRDVTEQRLVLPEPSDPEMPLFLRAKPIAGAPQKTAQGTPIYDAIMGMDAALLRLYKLSSGAVAREIADLPHMAGKVSELADRAASHPKMVVTALVGMTAATSLMMSTMNRVDGTAAVPAAAMSTMLDFSANARPTAEVSAPEETQTASDWYADAVSPEYAGQLGIKDELDQIKDPDARAILADYMRDSHFRHPLDINNRNAVLERVWPIQVALGVQEMWEQKPHLMKDVLGFRTQGDAFEHMLRLAAIESNSGEDLTNDSNPSVLGLYHEQDKTWINLMLHYDGLGAPESDVLTLRSAQKRHVDMKDLIGSAAGKRLLTLRADPRIATRTMLRLQAEDIANLMRRNENLTLSDARELLYPVHVYGNGALNRLLTHPESRPGAEYPNSRAVLQNPSLFFNFFHVARTSQQIIAETQKRYAAAPGRAESQIGIQPGLRAKASLIG